MKLEQVEKCCSGQVLGGEFMLYPEEEKRTLGGKGDSRLEF